MPEIKKFWPVHNAPTYSGSDGTNYLWTDETIKDDEHRLAHFCGAFEEGGFTIHHMIRIYNGTGQGRWEKENTKVYDNAADAKKDAEARFKKAKAKFDASQSDAQDEARASQKRGGLAERVVARHLARKKP
jgi:hypothetical protein